MDPIAGLLSPQNRRNAKSFGLLQAGLSLMGNSGWRPANQDPGALANIASAAQTGLAAYSDANARALEVQEYEQQIAAQKAEQEQLAQQEYRLKMIVENIGRDGQFRTPEQRQAWVAKAMSGGMETMQEAVSGYEESLNVEPIKLSDGDLLATRNPDGTYSTAIENTPDTDVWDGANTDLTTALTMVFKKPPGQVTSAEYAERSDEVAQQMAEIAAMRRGPGTNVNVHTAQLPTDPFARASTEDAAEAYAGRFRLWNSSWRGTQQITEMLRAKADGVPWITGPLAEQAEGALQLGRLFGIVPENLAAGVTMSQAINNISQQFALDVLKTGGYGSGSGLSDRDMQKAEGLSGAAKTDSPEARLATIYFKTIRDTEETRDVLETALAGTSDENEKRKIREELAALPSLWEIREQFANIKGGNDKPLLDWIQKDLDDIADPEKGGVIRNGIVVKRYAPWGGN